MRARSTGADVRTAARSPYHRRIADPTPDPSPTPPTLPDATAPLPSPAARAFAVLLIVVAGLCGGLIGYAVADLQCTGDCSLLVGASAFVGAVAAAGGVAVVAVLALRAMAEWDTVQERQQRSS
ncbi:MAG TPA: hypothetical protein PKA98_02175 [Acidimicrobiales bacterium]|nr:hypothetical protein [Acidimicrobiales bacterium]